MQCFKKAIEKDTKNLYELYDALLEGKECVSHRNTKNHTKAHISKAQKVNFPLYSRIDFAYFTFAK